MANRSIALNRDSTTSGGQDRPIFGLAAGSIVGQIPPNGLELAYTGRASHLGDFTRTETLFLNPDGSFVGQVVFVAANGDKLFADIDGQFISPTTAVGGYEFTGGTGRFLHATGIADNSNSLCGSFT